MRGGVLTFTDPEVGTVRWLVGADGATEGPYVQDKAGKWVLVPESDLDAAKWTFDWDVEIEDTSNGRRR